MNLDLTINSLIIFLFIIFPGIVFRRFYFQGEFTKQFNSKTWGQSLLMSFIPGLLIQILTFYIIKNLPSGTKFNFETFNISELTSLYRDLISFSFSKLETYYDILIYTFLYLILVISLSALIAQLLWLIVRGFKLDRRSKLLRFDNHWNYYFKGEIKDFKEFKNLNIGTVLLVKADILIGNESGYPILYSGILSQYTIKNKSNELENIYLTSASVWKEKKQTFIKKDIKSDCMIIPNKNILNINLNYVWKKKKEKDLTFLVSLFWIFTTIWILLSNNQYFKGETLFITILLKFFFIIYSMILITFFESLMKKERKKEELLGLGILLIFFGALYYLVRFIFF